MPWILAVRIEELYRIWERQAKISSNDTRYTFQIQGQLSINRFARSQWQQEAKGKLWRHILYIIDFEDKRCWKIGIPLRQWGKPSRSNFKIQSRNFGFQKACTFIIRGTISSGSRDLEVLHTVGQVGEFLRHKFSSHSQLREARRKISPFPKNRS